MSKQQFETLALTTGVTADYIRLSVGLENIADITADLDQALAAAV